MRKPVPPTDSDIRRAVLARCTYDPRAGELLRKPGRGVKAGSRIGGVDSNGRLQAAITVNGEKLRFQVDGLIWLLHYGKLPAKRGLLHIDGDPVNNHIDNLREWPKRMRADGKGWKCCLAHGIEPGRLGSRCSECVPELYTSPEYRARLRQATLAHVGPKQFGLFKHCSKCGEEKGVEDFGRNKKKGRHSWCKACVCGYTAERYRADPDAAAARRKDWERRNPGKIREYSHRNSRKRDAAKKRRIPSWSDLELVAQIYHDCPPGLEVDHIVPLQGALVSGLHVPSNLQYLTKSENSAKRNRYTPVVEVFHAQED